MANPLRAARARHGVITRAELLGVVPRRTIDHWLEAGRVERVHAGVYRVAGAPVTWEQQVLAAALAAGGVASHRSAARIWGLLDADEVEVTGRRVTGVRVRRSSDLEPHHTTRRNRIPVTTPMRTLVDLGAVAPWAVPDALELALVNRVCSLAAMERALGDVARRGRRGAGVLRAALDERALGAAPVDGLLEARFARLLREHGIEQPEFQYLIPGVGRVDAAWPARRLVAEVDGFAAHGTATALRHDLERQNRLVAGGWTPLRFTWWDVVRRPAYVAGALRVQIAA